MLSPGAPQDEFLQIYGIDEEGRIALQIWFDLEDMDAAIAELDAAHARFEQEAHRQARRLENAASQAPSATWRTSPPATGMRSRRYWPTTSCVDDRRRVVNAGIRHGRDAEIANLRASADVGITHIDVRRHRSPRGAPHPHARLGRRWRVRGIPQRAAGRRRNQLSTTRSRRSSCSSWTTSTPPSPSSMPATSPAKRLPTRTRGRWSRGTYAALNRQELPATDAGLRSTSTIEG